MEPAVKVVLAGDFQPAYSTGDFGDTDPRGFKASEKTDDLSV